MPNLFDETYKGNVIKLDVEDNAVDVEVPGTVAAYNSSNYNPEGSNNNCVESMTGTENRRRGTRTTARGST